MSTQARVQRLLQRMSQEGIDGLFVSSEPNVRYLSDFRNNESFLFLTQKKKYFLTDSRYVEQARKEARGFTVILRDTKPYPAMVEDLRKQEGCQTVGFEALTIPHVFYMQLCRSVPLKNLIPTKNLIEDLRIKKDKGEVDSMRRAIAIMKRGIDKLENETRPGMNEKAVQAKLEYDTKIFGSEKPAFDIIIARGAKSSMPHAVSDHKSVIKENDILLVDMGTVYNGYHCDLTRCFFMGKIPPLMRKVYQIVLDAQLAGIAKVKPGVRAAEVDKASRSYIARHGYGEQFGHGTGHGVGLEIHEAPTVSGRSNDILEPGMVVTVEPGIYLPNRFGVRIEDMVLVTEKGHEVLTRDIHKRI